MRTSIGRLRTSHLRGKCESEFVAHHHRVADSALGYANSWHCRGFQGPLSQAQSALSPCSTGAWRSVSRMPATNSKIMSYRCHRPSWNPGKLQPSLRSVINLYAAGFQNVVSAQRNLASARIEEFKASYKWQSARLRSGERAQSASAPDIDAEDASPEWLHVARRGQAIAIKTGKRALRG